MSNYRRCYVPGGSYIFSTLPPFRVDAMVMLHDLMHAIWTLPPDDAAYSKRWGAIKTFHSTLAHFGWRGTIP